MYWVTNKITMQLAGFPNDFILCECCMNVFVTFNHIFPCTNMRSLIEWSLTFDKTTIRPQSHALKATINEWLFFMNYESILFPPLVCRDGRRGLLDALSTPIAILLYSRSNQLSYHTGVGCGHCFTLYYAR